MFSDVHRSRGPARSSGRAFLVLCLVLAASSRRSAAASTEGRASSSSAFNSVFAIADFDGDREPDLATVEVESGDSPTATRYSIRFRLTTGAGQNFGVLAPAGGLQIVARDVNGDDAVDLLISTAWLHQEVAVLLNDGHGHFTLANPARFPAAVWRAAAVWNTRAVSWSDSAALVSSESFLSELEAINGFAGLRQQPGHGLSPTRLGRARLLLFSLLGRAPPSFFSHA